jgi:hypothetical protein
MSRPSEKALALTVAWFPTAMPQGPAIGDPEHITWKNFCDVLWFRRHGPKDGPGFCAARFKLEDDGRHVRRLKANVLARTAIAMDIELNKNTGEIPPSLEEIAKRFASRGWSAALWTSHNHRPLNDIRYRVVLPLMQEIDHELPSVEIIAADLGLAGVLDRSKLGAASYFYLPSCSGDDTADVHQEIIAPGAAIDAHWLTIRAKELQATRDAEADRAAAEAQAKAVARRAEMLAAGFDPDQSLIEQIRPHLGELDQILRDHGYDQRGYGNVATYRHPDSQSGSFGATVKTFAGIERVYSHNAGDPLHAANLPSWCTVSAIDAFDAVAILDFGGDRKRALRELSERFGLSKREENRAVARLIHQLIRSQASQETIETCAYAEGARLGLSRDEVIRVAVWIDAKFQHGKEAA